MHRRFGLLMLMLISILAHAGDEDARARLHQATMNPEYMLDHWISLPLSPDASQSKVVKMSLNDAILLALRYNPNIQNSELDNIINRYQLRIAYNEFELQYALAGSANFDRSHYSGVGSASNQAYLATPEFDLKTKLGTTLSLKMDNNVQTYDNYNPVLNFSLNQPLLRGFGISINTINLLNAKDTAWLNELNLKQSVMDQITQVIIAYRAMILSGHNLENQKQQLTDAKKTFEVNAKKIKAGQLEPTANIQQSYQIESLSLLAEQGENDFKIAAQQLLQAIGLDPAMRIKVPSDVSLERLTVPDRKEAIALALEQNAQFQAVKIAIRADERALKLAQNQQLWQLDLSGNIQTGTVTSVDRTNTGLQGIYNGRNVNESARITLNIPLNDLNRRKQLIDAKIRLEKDRTNLLAAKRALVTTVTNSINTIDSLIKRYHLAEKQVKLARQSYELQKKKQQAGIATSLDVSNTQNQLLQAQTGLINAKIAYLNERSNLERLLGTTLDRWQIKMRYGS